MLILVVAFVCGSVPFSNLVAHLVARTDLRAVGSGTVSGTGLYRVAGFVPLAVGGLLDIAKAVPAVLLAGDDALLAGLAAAAAVAGHNWSFFLGFAGGRGVSTAMGGFLVIAWPGVALLLGALAVGRLLRHTGLAGFVAICLLTPVLAVTSGADAALAACLVAPVMLAKRVAGNTALPPPPRRRAVAAHRLVFDNDGTGP